MSSAKRLLRRVLARLDWVFLFFYSLSGRILRRIHSEWDPRYWSNRELRKWGPLVKGDVINVSAWEDRDKEGGKYAEYFPNRKSYAISNYGGARGTAADQNQIILDLTAELPKELERRYDVVFNHTTLEHIYEARLAMRNICELSRDLVIIVVPFLQELHWEEGSFWDYWRFSPFAMDELFRGFGFRMIYCTTNDSPVNPVYLFCVGAREPERWIAEMRNRGIAPLYRGVQDRIPGRSSSEFKRPPA